ncbi:MAG: hypothetical protein O2955_00250 [Planctomycetota bacterium]|nr:hypothetical protein [Planctomycetota bacterium]MDA1210911.1 hypothetical protein [Planctomycetota bacterium]
MDSAAQLVNSLIDLVIAIGNVLLSVVGVILPWTPLIVWVAFWLLAVNWSKLRPVLLQGGWIGVIFIGLMMVLIWGSIAPPAEGFHHFFGLTVSNYVGKTVYVTILFSIMFICGAVQLAGVCDCCVTFPEDEVEAVAHASHGHDDHGH